jgi:G:T-mismatch repair DNA endonuclease (very short patch repair protein)
MAENLNPGQRGLVTPPIKSINTKTEMIIWRMLRCPGLRYRIHAANSPSKSDIIYSVPEWTSSLTTTSAKYMQGVGVI